MDALERAKESYKKALENESTFKDLSPKEQELKLNISIIKALEALDQKDSINQLIRPLEDQIHNKQADLDSKQGAINSIKGKQISINEKVKELQTQSYRKGSDIARLEGSLNNLIKIESQSKVDIEKAKSNYNQALENESNNDHLNPKEKAIRLLDSIIDLLKVLDLMLKLLIKKS